MEEENTSVEEGGQSNPDVVEKEQPQKSSGSKPAGYDPVDISALPDDVRDAIDSRFKYLYRQVKDTGRHLNDYKSLAKQQSEAIEELMNNMGQVVDHIEGKNIADTENALRQQMMAAFDAGDNARYLELQDKLLELKVKKASQVKEKPKKQEKQAPTPQRNPSPNELANEAVLDGEISAEDLSYLESWQGESGQSGESLRPWAMESHPLYPQAYNEMLLVFSNPVYQKLSFDQKLAEIDRRMGVQSRSPSQNVMGGGLTAKGKTSRITLSPKQQEIAVRTKFGGSKAKSEAEHIEAYRKQIEKLQSGKRSR